MTGPTSTMPAELFNAKIPPKTHNFVDSRRKHDANGVLDGDLKRAIPLLDLYANGRLLIGVTHT